jgi:hypothetical protein
VSTPTFTPKQLHARIKWCEEQKDIDKPEMRMVRDFAECCRYALALEAERDALKAENQRLLGELGVPEPNEKDGGK